MKRFRFLALTLGLAVLLLSIQRSGREVDAALMDDAAAMEAAEKYTAAQQIGQIRKNVGLQTLTLESSLNTAADNHSNYMERIGKVTFEEIPQETGFTGGYPADRAAYAGFQDAFIIEYDNYRMVSFSDFINWCLGDPYLRTSLLSPHYNRIGFSRSGYYYCMMLGGRGYEGNAMTTIYPYAGQVEVPGVELVDLSVVPQAIEAEAGQSIGMPITVQYCNPNCSDLHFEQIEAEILDSGRGTTISYEMVAPQDEGAIWNTLILYPMQNYTSSTRYTVSVSFDVYEGDTWIDKVKEKWSFTSVGPDFMGGIRRDTVLKDLLGALSAPEEDQERWLAGLTNPSDYATREQTIVWMIELLNECVPEVMASITVDYKETYEDINQCEEEARDLVQTAYQMRLIEDQGRGILNPKALMSRAELEKILSRLRTRFQVHWPSEEEEEPEEISEPEESAEEEPGPEGDRPPEDRPKREEPEGEEPGEEESQEEEPEEPSSEPSEEETSEEESSEETSEEESEESQEESSSEEESPGEPEESSTESEESES